MRGWLATSGGVSDLPMGSDVGLIPTNQEIIRSVVDILGSYVESQKSYLFMQRQG